MARGRKLETIEDYKRSLRNGYGLGQGKDYKPWIRVEDTPSKGVSSKIFGIKTQREHHTLSNIESELFYIADFLNPISDIREQFPLLPLTLSAKIAKTLNISHPIVPKTKELNVITTDFLLTIQTSEGVKYEAVNVKPLEDLRKSRTLEKIEIERAWWESIGIPFHVYTGNKLTKIQSRNICWATQPIRQSVFFDHEDELNILERLTTGKKSIKETLKIISKFTHLNNLESMIFLQSIIGKKYITVDLNYPIIEKGYIDIRRINVNSLETSNASYK